MDDAGVFIVIAIVKGLFSAVVGSLIGALFLQGAARLVCKFMPPYGSAYGACFWSALAGGFVGVFFGFSLAEVSEGAAIMVPLVIGFFISSGIVGAMLKNPEDVSIGFGKGVLVVFVQTLFVVAIVMIPVLLISAMGG